MQVLSKQKINFFECTSDGYVFKIATITTYTNVQIDASLFQGKYLGTTVHICFSLNPTFAQSWPYMATEEKQQAAHSPKH